MTLNTTKIGLTVLDRAFGGIYLHRPTLICGRNKSGKSVIATHLAMKTLLSGENLVLFTDKSPEEFMLNADASKIDLSQAIASGQFTLIPYSTMTREGGRKYSPLPFPEALDELRELVKTRHISYVIFDTIVPWMAKLPLDDMPEHVDSTITAFNEMGLTSLLLLPEPASPGAKKLTELLRELCPINMEIESRSFGAEFILRVTKYQGGNRAKLPLEFSLNLLPGVGFEQVSTNDMVSLKTDSANDDLTATSTKPKARTYKPFVSSGLADFSSAQPQKSAGGPASSAQPVRPAGPRPFISGGLSDFSGAPPAGPAIKPVPFGQSANPAVPPPQKQPNPTIRPTYGTKQQPAPKPTGAQPSFADTMNYAPIAKEPSPTPNVKDGKSSAPNQNDGAKGIKFSSIIR